jgi:hypothetical protein
LKYDPNCCPNYIAEISAPRQLVQRVYIRWALMLGYKMANCVASESLVLWKNLSSATSQTTNSMLADSHVRKGDEEDREIITS